jgi:hypothetical protein
MEELERLEQRQQAILEEMSKINTMCPGSVAQQYLKGKKKGQSEPVLRGPYWIHTRRVKGKSVSVRLQGEEATRVQQLVDNYHRFQELVREYASIGEEIADLHKAGGMEPRKKKRSTSKSHATKK